jgi:UDP-N-acetylglucosamine 4,6-dehydratase
VVEAALEAGVHKVIALSTDKAVNPANLYGATKLAAEKLTVQSNAYSGERPTRFSCVRYGNVVGSRGSVVPVFLRQRQDGALTITDERMTRFWISLDQGARFVLRCIEQMQGGEVFVPKLPSTTVYDLARAIAPEAKLDVVGIRPGEKLHEALISEDEARTTLELDDMYVIQPAQGPWFVHSWEERGKPVPEGFHYVSNENGERLSVEEIQAIVAPIEAQWKAGTLA